MATLAAEEALTSALAQISLSGEAPGPHHPDTSAPKKVVEVTPNGTEPTSSEAATTAYSSSDTSSVNDGSLEASLLESYLQSGQLAAGQDARAADLARASFEQLAAKPQICFDFTKGVCTRGDKCKYSHDLATIVHFNSREKGICFDYLRNQCTRGLLCRFSHDLSNIAQQAQLYNNVAAASVQSKVMPPQPQPGKPNAICYDFVKGVCQRGSECRYSHDLTLIARVARGGPSAPKTAEVCYDYLRGRCNRGVTCKYSHNISFLAAPSFMGPGSGPNSNGQLPGGVAPVQGPQAAGGSFTGGNGAGLLAQSLSTALSADQATLHAYAAAAAADRQRMSMNGEMNDTSAVNDQPQQWPAAGGHIYPPNMPGMPGAKNAISAQQAAMLSSFAAQHQAQQVQQQRLAAVAAGLGGYPSLSMPLAMPPGHHHPDQVMNQGPPLTSTASAPIPGLHHMHMRPMGGMPGMDGHHYQQLPGQPGPNMVRPPHQGAQGLTPESIAAILSGMPDNPNLLADTLSSFAAAAKAQAAQQAQARMMGQGQGVPGGMPPMQQHPGGGPSNPQPIPGAGPDGPGGQGYPAGGAAANQEALSRSGPGADHLNPAALSPDLLPMIREIWQNKAPGC